MVDTKGRIKSKAWYKAWFPEPGYLGNNGKPHVMKTGTGRITGTKRVPENAPWDFAANHAGEGDKWGPLTIYGYRLRLKTGGPSWWRRYEKKDATADEYAALMKSLNYYQNGNKTASGNRPGLDPIELIGGVRSWDKEDYDCRRGTYTARSIVDQEAATFVFDNADIKPWTGDLPPAHNPTWT